MPEQPDLVQLILTDPDIATAKHKLQAFCNLYKADPVMVLQVLIAEQKVLKGRQ
jgi:hypothetical protein